MKVPIPQQYKTAVMFLGLSLLYIAIVSIRIPIVYTEFLHRNSTFVFVLVASLYYLSFKYSKKVYGLAGYLTTTVLCALTISYLWNSGFSNSKIIAGLLPQSDALRYFDIAQLTMRGVSRTPSFIEIRPLFPGFLSFLLLITKQNLQWVVLFIIGMTGLCCYWSAQRVYELWGVESAAIYMALLWFYAKNWTIYLMTEPLGIMFGCISFILLSKSAETSNRKDLVLGLIALVVGLSVRAGAMFTLPLLIVWAGWGFRGTKKFSFRVAGITVITMGLSLLTIYKVYAPIITGPSEMRPSNFAYVLYGQAVGGRGAIRAFKVFKNLESTVIYRAAIDTIIEHPSLLLKATIQSYKDFFLPNKLGVFNFGSQGMTALDVAFWIGGIAMMILGISQYLRLIKLPIYSLFLATFIGIFLSIPFLPPIDTGNRVYATTMPFLFALPASGLCYIMKILPRLAVNSPISIRKNYAGEALNFSLPKIRWFLASLILAVLIAPIFIKLTANTLSFDSPTCPPDQAPFAIEMHRGSYVNLIADSDSCGLLPNVCLSNYQKSTIKLEPFTQALYNKSVELGGNTRVVIANNLVNNDSGYFVGLLEYMSTFDQEEIITGCADETRINYALGRIKFYRSILTIKSINN